MTQLGIVTLHRIGICFAFGYFIPAEMIPKPIISLKRIRVIPFCLGGIINHFLNGWLSTLPNDFPAQIAACLAIYERDDVDPVFFCPIKVNNSSISATLTSWGTGASGELAALALTHNETVR